MPAEGLPWLPGPDILTDDEVARLVGVAVTRLGITEVRFTGGEPLLRPGLVGIVRQVTALRPRPQVSLTTNGIGLARIATGLRAAGLDRINVSLNTLDRARFSELARRDRLADVIDGLAAAAAAGLTPVKVNAVLMRGINEGEAPALLRWCLERGYELRFIEQMPLDAQHGWRRDTMITAEEILRRCAPSSISSPRARRSGHRTGGDIPGQRRAGPVGVIASVTAVLRQLRPGAVDRGRSGAHLPVRPR
jgi:cyclic pyranopterin phosphate synthase